MGCGMMAMKMLITDLDRTLLRTDKSVSDFTLDTLKKCRARGIKIVFATARPKNRVDIFPFAALADAVITDNGAVLYIENRVVNMFGIPPETAKPFVGRLVGAFPDRRISIEYPHLKVANFDTSELWLAPIVNDIAHPLDADATKMIVSGGAEIYAELTALLPGDLYAQLCEGTLILIMHRLATKWNAIKKAAAYYGVPLSDTIAFGDDLNDIEMLQNCGIGVAVANALDEVKAAANGVCGSNEADGVARWIAEHLIS